LGGKSAADKGKDTRDYLAAAFPELNAWERAGADASSAGMVDAGFENQKDAKKSGMVNITSSVNSRERSGINTILHELNPLFTINVTMRDIKSKNVYSRVNSKATTQWRKTESANGVHLEGVASDNR